MLHIFLAYVTQFINEVMIHLIMNITQEILSS